MQPKVEVAEQPVPSVRYLTRTLFMDEALVDTRWIGRYWSPTERREVTPVMPGPLWRHSAFGLELDGQSLHYGWRWDGAKELDDEPGSRAHAVVSLTHATRPVSVRVHSVLDGTAVFTRWLEIENTADRPAALSQVWVWSGRVFPSQGGEASYGVTNRFQTVHGDFELGWFADGKHCNEGDFRWRPVEPRGVEIGEDTGKSGWGHPICYLRDGKAGQIFVAQLAWSGNWLARVERHDNLVGQPDTSAECVYLRMGPWAPGPQRVIAPGETLRTPEIHIGAVAGDLDEMVRELHDHQRRSVLPTSPRGGGCLINYSAGTIGDKTQEQVLREVDFAAEAGAEVFKIDAGWYGIPGESWGRSVGYWHPGQHLPQGFAPVVDYVHSKGLKFALWVWIEAAAADSPIIKEHPDWLLHRDGKPQAPQLDLSKREVAAWVESEIVRIIEEYGVDVFRLDYNAYPGEGGYNPRDGFDENTLWRHYEEFYAIWDRVAKRFPNLILENCAGGGARTDVGMMSRFHYTWISDYYPSPRGLRIVHGMLAALAPEAIQSTAGGKMNGHLGADPVYQLRTACLGGNPQIYDNIHDGLSNPASAERVSRTLRLFKETIRPLIPVARVFRHTPVLHGMQPEGWCVVEYAAPDRSHAVIWLFRLAGDCDPLYCLMPCGISKAGDYEVYLDNDADRFRMSGRDLATRGLPVRLPAPLTSELVILTHRSAT